MLAMIHQMDQSRFVITVTDDDGDGLIDVDDPDCRQPGEEFRFDLSNCQATTGVTQCEAEQISPLPPTYDRNLQS